MFELRLHENVSPYVSEDEYEYDIEDENYNEIEYEYDEYVETRFVIALCELHNAEIHGSGPDGHYLVHCKYKKLDMKWIKETTDFMHFNYQHLHNRTHRIFPNYSRIIFRPNYMKPEIVEYLYLQPDNHCVAIIKTIWIKIIQRAWKKVFKKRNTIRKSIAGLRYRELTGRWPYFPGLSGLLMS